jgi:hypothetical protein
MAVDTIPSPLETVLAETKDVSERIKSLMRKIDRLPPGLYELTIAKAEVRAMDWDITVVRLEPIETFSLSKYQPE